MVVGSKGAAITLAIHHLKEFMTADHIRLPITLFVDKVEFDPDVEFRSDVIKTSYDIELTEKDAILIIEGLKKRIDGPIRGSIRIRVVGRLVSQ